MGALGLGTVLAAFLGLALQGLIGFHFGAGRETDAYFMSLSIVAFLAKVLMFGHLKSIALPVYLGVGEGGGTARRGFVRRLAIHIALALGAVTVAAVLLAPWLVDLLAPGYDGELRDLTVRLLRIRAPALLFLGGVTVSLVLLEAAGRFGRVALGQKVIPALVTVVLLALVGDRWGVPGLAWMGLAGAAAGGVALVVAGLGSMKGAEPAGRDDDDPVGTAVGGVWRSWARFGWSNAATTAAEWVYRVAASTLGPGLFSAVVFGRMVHDLLHGAINDAATTVALPEFARGDAAGNGKTVGGALAAGLETLSAVTVPIAIFVALMSHWIAALLFGRGQLLRDGMLGPIGTSMALFMVGFVVQGRNQLAFQAAFATGRSDLVNRSQVIGHVFRAVILIPSVWVGSFVGLVFAQVAMNVVVAGSFWISAPDDLARAGRRFLGGMMAGLGSVTVAILAPLLLFTTLVLPALPVPTDVGELGRVGVLALSGVGWVLLVVASARVVGVPALRRVPGFK